MEEAGEPFTQTSYDARLEDTLQSQAEFAKLMGAVGGFALGMDVGVASTTAAIALENNQQRTQQIRHAKLSAQRDALGLEQDPLDSTLDSLEDFIDSHRRGQKASWGIMVDSPANIRSELSSDSSLLSFSDLSSSTHPLSSSSSSSSGLSPSALSSSSHAYLPSSSFSDLFRESPRGSPRNYSSALQRQQQEIDDTRLALVQAKDPLTQHGLQLSLKAQLQQYQHTMAREYVFGSIETITRQKEAAHTYVEMWGESHRESLVHPPRPPPRSLG